MKVVKNLYYLFNSIGDLDCWPSLKVVSVTQISSGTNIGTSLWLKVNFGISLYGNTSR